MVSAVASRQEGSGFESELRRFCAEFACSPRVRVGLLRVLRFPPTVQKTCKTGVRLIGDSKLPVGVNGCSSLYVSPVMNWRLVQGVPGLAP